MCPPTAFVELLGMWSIVYKNVIAVCMLIQEDDQEPVYTELKREKEDEKSKIKV